MSDLIAKITQLSVAERILLIQEILNTIAVDTKESLTTAQKKEIDQRSASIKNGTVKTKSWDSIEAALTQRYEL